MTVALTPNPFFFWVTPQGQPAVGYQLFTYVAGTSIPQATYTDSTQTQQNTNPVVLNAYGYASVWLVTGLTYKLILTDAAGNLVGSQDQIAGGGFVGSANLLPTVTNTYNIGSPALTWANGYFGTAVYIGGASVFTQQTAAELAAGVTPVNYQYAPGVVDRYGTNATPGSTSMAAALQAAVNQCLKGGSPVSVGLTAPYLIDSSINATTPVGSTNYGLVIRGISGQSLAVTDNAPYRPTLVFKTSGHAFDTTGSLGITVENLTVTTDLTTFPLTCFLLARNTNGSSRSDRFTNVRVYGLFANTIIYNYGAEDDMYVGCVFYNANPAANTSVYDISAFNIRGLTSAFTTIATGNQSCLDHKIFGGEWANFAGTATSDVIRLDAARSIKIYGPWMDSSTQSASASGRSLIYVDGTNGPTAIVELMGIDGEEAGAFPATYGILFSNNAQTHSNFVVIGNTFPNITAMLGGGSGATLTQFTWFNNTNQSTGGGINFSGTLSSIQIDSTPGGVIGTPLTYNETWGVSQGIAAPGEVDFSLRDTTQAAGSQVTKFRSNAGGLTISTCDNFGNVTANLFILPRGSALAGWGAPTGAAVVNNYSGSAATLVQTSNAVAEIIAKLIQVGLFNA